jgi:biotin transport system substrate-specific component
VSPDTTTPQRPSTSSRSSRANSPDPRSVALVAVFAALIVAAALVPGIPVGALAVPITLQTLAVMLTGLCLGAVRGALATLLYLALGFAGLPVFSGGRSGLQVMTTPSAGYLAAFVVAAFVVGLAAQQILRRARTTWRLPLFFLAAMLTSVVFVHTLGVLGMTVTADMSLGEAFTADLVFYPGDIIKNVVAAIAATAIHRAFPDILVRRVR